MLEFSAVTTTVATQSMYAGEKKVLQFTVLNKDAVGDPPLDLTTYTVRWAMSRVGDAGYSATAALRKDTGGLGGIVKTDAANGVCQVTLLRADTEAIALGLYHQELEVVDGAGEIAVVAVGDIEVLRNVSNA